MKAEIASEVERRLEAADLTSTVDLGKFLWARDGKALYFEARSGDVWNLWKVGVDPKSLRWEEGPERLTTGTGRDAAPAISPDGKQFAFSRQDEKIRIWSFPFNPATGELQGGGEPVTPAGLNPINPDLSRDGRKLAFAARRVGRWELWEVSLEDRRDTLLASRPPVSGIPTLVP